MYFKKQYKLLAKNHVFLRKTQLKEEVEHEVRSCTANSVEQSHKGIKHPYYPTLEFGEFEAAQRFCQE